MACSYIRARSAGADQAPGRVRACQGAPGLPKAYSGPGAPPALKECIAEQGLEVEAKSHADSIYAGAIGGAIRGAFRYEKLAGLGQLPKAS